MFTVSFSSVWNGQVVKELRRRKYLVFMTAQGFEVNMKSNRPYLVSQIFIFVVYHQLTKLNLLPLQQFSQFPFHPLVADVKWVAVSC